MAERLSLSEMRGRSTGHFFDRSTMRFFSAATWQTSKQRTTYGSRYDKETGINYIVVTDPWGEKHYHKFNPENGEIDPVRKEDIPLKFRMKDLPVI